MSNVPILDAASDTRKVDTFQRTEGPDTVEIQAVAIVNPTTGDPLLPDASGRLPVTVASSALPTGAATQTTLAALNVIAAAVQAAVEAINGKTPALNAGSVALDSTTLAALETINANTGGLTNAELRAAALDVVGTFWPATQPISALALPLPTGAATEATLASVIHAEDTASADGDSGIVLLAQRRDTDATAVSTDGDYATLKSDETGRLKVSTQPASYALGTGSITANAQTVFLNVERASNVTINMVATSLVGHNVTFEYSHNSTTGTDGNWYGVQAVRSNANTVETATGVLAATPAYGWELSVNAYKWVRVRATAHTSGTAAYVFTPGAYATEPVPAIQVTGTQPISGSVTATLAAAAVRAGFLAASGIWYDDTSTVLAANATFTGTARDATLTATATAFANAATYAQEVRASAESDQSGTLWIEYSRDNVNWRRAKSVPTAAVTGGGQFAEVVFRPSWRYWRAGFTNGATLQTRMTLGSLASAL